MQAIGGGGIATKEMNTNVDDILLLNSAIILFMWKLMQGKKKKKASQMRAGVSLRKILTLQLLAVRLTASF